MAARARAVLRFARTFLHLLHGFAIVRIRFPSLGPAARLERVRWWSAELLRILGIATLVEGRPAAGSAMLAANHISWLDVMVVHAVVPQARFISKADVRAWPLIAPMIDATGTLYIERERKRDALRVVHETAAALRRGDIVALFPESTTSAGHDVLPFHANLLQAAITTGSVVQPVALRYADATHAVSEAMEFVGATTMLQSLWGAACGEGVVARLAFLPPRLAAGVERRTLAALVRADIVAALAAFQPPRA